MEFSIGSLKLPYPFLLAPLSGISNLPFRMISRKLGCPCAFVEMIDAGSLSHATRKTFELLKSVPGDRPLGIQLLGGDAGFLLRAMEKLSAYEFDLLDFNAACPKKKVTGKGKGAALLRDPEKLQKLLKIIVKNSPVPVTAKIRLGWEDERDCLRIASLAEDTGIDALIVHGRTARQGYGGRVSYAEIARIKKRMKIPVVASGDIFDVGLAKKMFDETGCDAVIVARGALGNPWIFASLIEFFRTGNAAARPAREAVVRIMKEHYNMCAECFGEQRAAVRFRKFFIWYTYGFANVKKLRRDVERISSRRELFTLIEEFSSVRDERT